MSTLYLKSRDVSNEKPRFWVKTAVFVNYYILQRDRPPFPFVIRPPCCFHRTVQHVRLFEQENAHTTEQTITARNSPLVSMVRRGSAGAAVSETARKRSACSDEKTGSFCTWFPSVWCRSSKIRVVFVRFGLRRPGREGTKSREQDTHKTGERLGGLAFAGFVCYTCRANGIAGKAISSRGVGMNIVHTANSEEETK